MSDKLSTKDFAEVLEALYPARSKWRNIGTQLKIDVHELDSIETEGGMSLDKKLDLMINRRLEMKEPCTWRNLYDALNHPTVAMSDVAKELPGPADETATDSQRAEPELFYSPPEAIGPADETATDSQMAEPELFYSPPEAIGPADETATDSQRAEAGAEFTQPGCVPVSRSKQRLNELQMKSYGNYTEMMEEIKKMIKFREVTIELMRSVADELERIHRPANNVKLVSAVGVVGGIVAVVAGIALSPFTAGTSALAGAAASVAITGGVVAAGTGAATHIGTQAVETILERLDLAKVQSAVDKDKEQCEKVGRLWKELKLSNGFVHETKTIIDREAASPTFVSARLLIDAGSLLQIAETGILRDVLHDIPSEAVKILRWKSLLLNVEYNNWKRIIDV